MKLKLFCCLLTLILLLSAFAGCGVTENGADTDPTSATQTTATPDTTTSAPVQETTPEPVVVIPDDAVIASGGEVLYDIILSEGVEASDEQITMARSINTQLQSLLGTGTSMRNDWVKEGREHDRAAYEILVGVTNYPETQQVAQSIGYGDYAIRAIGNKIVIFAYHTKVLQVAVTRFNQMLASSVSADGKSITLSGESLMLTEATSTKLSALPTFDGGNFYAYYEAGFDCDELIIRDTTPDMFEAYLKKLDTSGFRQYTTHEMADNLFATYTNDKYTVTVGYYDYESSVRLLIEPLAPAVGLESENVYTPITTSQITMFGAAYTSGTAAANNGLSVLIRLTDGRFVIVDGGHNYAGCARSLLTALEEQSAAYAKTKKDITIAAWIITHPHGDHNGVFNNYYQLFRDMTVERVLVSQLSETERVKSIQSVAYSGNWGASEGLATNTIKGAEQLGAELHQVHVGQVYYFADLKMEILFTIESFAPSTCNALNTTSTVMRMEFGGDTVYLSTGDATGNGMEICDKMYGDYLQSDIVQVCHHGYTTWGNDAGMIAAYKTINAPTVLWPQGRSGYNSARSHAYNFVLFTVPNYKEVYVSGSVGDQIIVPIPYQVGNAKTVRATG